MRSNPLQRLLLAGTEQILLARRAQVMTSWSVYQFFSQLDLYSTLPGSL